MSLIHYTGMNHQPLWDTVGGKPLFCTVWEADSEYLLVVSHGQDELPMATAQRNCLLDIVDQCWTVILVQCDGSDPRLVRLISEEHMPVHTLPKDGPYEAVMRLVELWLDCARNDDIDDFPAEFKEGAWAVQPPPEKKDHRKEVENFKNRSGTLKE